MHIVDYIAWLMVLGPPLVALLTYLRWPSIGYTLPLLVSAVLGLAALVFITVRIVKIRPRSSGLYAARACMLVAVGPLVQFLIALHTPLSLQLSIAGPLVVGCAVWFIAEIVQAG